MIKNRTVQLVFQTVYCVLAIFGVIGSLGYFVVKFNSDFYIMYTNLSNYICIVFMYVSLVCTIKKANKKEDGAITLAPTFKFMCVIMILVTFFVYNIYNIVPSKTIGVRQYFTSVPNLTMHLVLPIMFVLDWVLFYEHGKTRWYYPLISIIMPLVYVVYVLIRAGIASAFNITLNKTFPYFFLDFRTLGWGGLFGWLFVLIAIFVALGYLFYVFDNLKRWKTSGNSKVNK